MNQSSNETQNAVSQLVEDIAEKPHPPRSKDLSFYLVLLFAVIPIWSVVPVSWAFVIYSLRTGKIYTFAWKGRLYFAVALCEVRSSSLSQAHLGFHSKRVVRRSSLACTTTTSPDISRVST